MTRPTCILVAAMGGEGGGVLADWLIHAATQADFPVQSTSVPGVAQRTGATTYYVEIFPRPRSELGGREPVLSLTPVPGQLDIVAASELVEAGRSIQTGYVSPDRTTLLASTHREFAVVEKAAMGDGRYDTRHVFDAAAQRSKRAVLLDMRALARRNGTVINTVLFGAMCGAGVLPFERESCEAAIRHSGKAVDSSLKGFAAGFDAAAGHAKATDKLDAAVQGAAIPASVRDLPEAVRAIAASGVELTGDYQDSRYADLYLTRVQRMVEQCRANPGDMEAAAETARYLALWMCYEDVIRVAQLKTRRERLVRVRQEVGARNGEPLRLTEFLKPGIDEIADLLPPGPARWLRARATGKWHHGMHLRTDTVRGFLMLCALRGLRPIRRFTSRFKTEQALIEQWIDAVNAALPGPRAIELALSGNLVKGYGETSRRGHRSLAAVLELARQGADAQALRAARLAALADPEGRQLSKAVGRTIVPQPIRIVRRKPVN
ncbi:MAG: indolepyruvate oxidoreductase subunit beta family protein [Proteobacteria bacterium]|nr:indolepyruvate oxidoreductase subunit beta family protein [Pseudomonadota bacterium]